jgi:hypothetical protein
MSFDRVLVKSEFIESFDTIDRCYAIGEMAFRLVENMFGFSLLALSNDSMECCLTPGCHRRDILQHHAI